jgi:hypothetical protein
MLILGEGLKRRIAGSEHIVYDKKGLKTLILAGGLKPYHDADKHCY